MITRFALIAGSAVAIGGLMAAPALAQSPPTQKPATAVGAEQATVSGVVDTGTIADGTPCYSFEYDTLADFTGPLNNPQSTAPVCLTPGTGMVPVTAVVGCFPAASCSLDASPLTPGTVYQAVLSVSYQVTGSPTANELNSNQVEFSTKKLGALTLKSSTIHVKHGVASVGLSCSSTQPCNGTVQVTARHHGRVLKCFSSRISMKPGRHGTISGSLAGACRSVLSAAGTSGLAGTLMLSVTTDQQVGGKKPVTLVAG
jgi:hypothetical protein